MFPRYDGFKVIRTVPRSSDQAEYLASLEDDLHFNFWTNGIRFVLYMTNATFEISR